MFSKVLFAVLLAGASADSLKGKVSGGIATTQDAHTAGLDFVYLGDLVPETASVGYASYAVHEHFDKSC